MSSTANLYPAPGAVTATGQLPIAQQLATSTATGNLLAVTGTSPTEQSRLATFEGLLKKAGHLAGVVLADVVKYVIPIASVVAIADPATAPAVVAFTASVRLVQATVINVQQKWASEGAGANTQKLSDVLSIVEQPVVTMFAQVGIHVDTAYVTNLVNGVVAILNAQPGAVLPVAA